MKRSQDIGHEKDDLLDQRSNVQHLQEENAYVFFRDMQGQTVPAVGSLISIRIRKYFVAPTWALPVFELP